MNWVADLGAKSLQIIVSLGRAGRFFAVLTGACLTALIRFSLVVKQLYSVGVLTLLIILVSGLFVGMVLGLQGYYTLVSFGAESSLGLVVALSLTRELGPVLSALLFAGRAGSALTAEIGLMKATQQLDAMEMMATDPLPIVIAPRFLAGIIALPLLSAIFTAIGVIGGYLIGVQQLGLDSGVYWSAMQEGVDFYDDIINGVIKSLAFGLVVTFIAVYQGYFAVPTSEGVSRATTRTVVNASLSVLGLDYVLTALMFGEI